MTVEYAPAATVPLSTSGTGKHPAALYGEMSLGDACLSRRRHARLAASGPGPAAPRSLLRSIAGPPLIHRQLESGADREIERTRRQRRPLAMLSIGIDHFERPWYGGILSSAQVLRSVARACASELRGGDTVGRVDSTSYLALLPGVDSKGALRIAERLRTAIAAIPTPAQLGRARRITVSIGVVATRTGRTSYRALRSRADAKRDDASHSGGNRVHA